jgi:hypothetical protein
LASNKIEEVKCEETNLENAELNNNLASNGNEEVKCEETNLENAELNNNLASNGNEEVILNNNKLEVDTNSNKEKVEYKEVNVKKEKLTILQKIKAFFTKL